MWPARWRLCPLGQCVAGGPMSGQKRVETMGHCKPVERKKRSGRWPTQRVGQVLSGTGRDRECSRDHYSTVPLQMGGRNPKTWAESTSARGNGGTHQQPHLFTLQSASGHRTGSVPTAASRRTCDVSPANTIQAVVRLRENRYPPPLTRSAKVTLCVGGRFSRWVAVQRLRDPAARK